MDKKNAAHTEANAPQAPCVECKPLKLCPRQLRVALALMLAGDGWTWREEIDRIAGASNGPAIISALRRKGVEIEMQKVERIDRDGKPCNPGRYRLKQKGFAVLVSSYLFDV